MVIVVDTSVWSLLLRRKSATIREPAVNKLRFQLEGKHGVVLLGPILQELLTGVTPQHQERLGAYLEGFPMTVLEREDFMDAATLMNLGRKKGVAVGAIDGLIAASCIRRGLPLLSTDQDFGRIAAFSELILF